jgi:hypothetical protein
LSPVAEPLPGDPKKEEKDIRIDPVAEKPANGQAGLLTNDRAGASVGVGKSSQPGRSNCAPCQQTKDGSGQVEGQATRIAL